MAKYEVVPYRFYRRVGDGRTASIHGAVPWRTPAEKELWTEVQEGFTVYNPLTNQYGIGRKPWATREEAQTWADKNRPSHIGIGD